MFWKHSLEKRFDQVVQHHINESTNFTFISLLGFGSYGRTYLVEDTTSHQIYVLKCLRPKHRLHKKTKHKFIQEIQMLQQLSLPFTPSIKMTGMIQDLPFFVMDFIDGQTFEQLIFKNGQVFTVAQSLLVTQQLLKQIVALHQKGIVHRDLRIPNILLVNDQLHIIDFGLAAYIKKMDLSSIRNPKRAENHISDLYFVGHFLLFLLYSSYKPTTHKERSWQEELSLPDDIKLFLERLLCIKEPFHNAEEALQMMPYKK